MQLQKEFLQELRNNFRLNIYEVKIWTALLSRGIASAGELADISGVPRSRCYDVLESLEKKGFIIMKIGKPIKYLAIKPDAILERVKKSIEDEAGQLAAQYESIKDTEEFKELELLHKTGVQHVDISSISKSIVGRSAVNRSMKDLLSKAKSKIVIVSSGENSERCAKLMKNFMPGFAKKNVRANLYCQQNKALVKKLENVEYGEYDSNSTFMTIDGKEMLFIVSQNNVAPDYEVAIWMDSPMFVKAVDILFEGSLK